MKRKKVFCALLAIVIISLPSAAFPGNFVGFGPQNYTRGSGSPVAVTNAFTVLNPNTGYTLQIYNGGLVDGEFEKVSISVISLNGVQIVGPNEFNQNVTLIEKPVTLAVSNQLSVELRGKPGGGITLLIIGVDNDPPTIAAAVNPAPNAAGWHKSDATVSFTCADSESGVASCPAPITVSTEGANQLISGTATDLAGNSASTSVSISLDKTAPTVAISSPANGSSVSTSPVRVTGTSMDNLSGIATVLCNGSTASLSASTFSCDVPLTNGPNTITAEATDIASNKGSSSITVTLGQPLEPQSPPVVFGPHQFTQPNEAVAFLVANPVGPFWLQVFNGQDGQNLVDSGSISINGVLVAGPQDFVQDSFGFQKDVTLQTLNTLEVELSGVPGSFLTVQIREAEPNVTVSNQTADLSGINEGHAIGLVWSDDDRAAEYVVSRAASIQGPWQELFRTPQDRTNFMDFTPDARLMDLCYKVEARDAGGLGIRFYEPICVPKFVEPQTQTLSPQKSPISDATDTTQIQLTPLIPELHLASWRLSPTTANLARSGLYLAGSFLQAQATQAEPNVTVSNQTADLSGINEGHAIGLVWSDDDRAAEYVVSRAASIQGPWQELFRVPRDRSSYMDFTPDARLRQLCYRVEAVDASGAIMRRYEPVCIPKFVERQGQSLNHEKSLIAVRGTETGKTQRGPRYSLQLASLNMMAAAPDPPINDLCFSNPDPEFTDFGSRSKDDIQRFLEERGSFLQRRIEDVDPNRTPIGPAKVIFDAAQKFQINPEVLIAILQREQKAITAGNKLGDRRLRRIMGWDRADQFVPLANKSVQQQIFAAAKQLRDDLNRLISGTTTIGSWKKDFEKMTTDGVIVSPTSKPAAVMYSYNPEVGELWGGGRGVGGNSRFCDWWEKFGFRRDPVAISPQNPTLVCGPDASVTFTATGGKPPYKWSTSNPNAVITPGADTKSAVLKPPENPGSGVAGTAYVKRIAHVGSDCSLNLFNGVTWVCYNCAGVEFTCPPSGDPCFGQTCPQQNCGAGAGDCGQLVCGFTKCACLQPAQNVGDPASLELARSGGAVCDIRTQAVKDAGGCKPCAVEMQGGATVTATDAAGASFSTPVAVQ